MPMPSANPLSDEDYDAIEAAVMETSRGRWFLAEYARRNRNADTGVLIDAIGRLEKAMEGGKAAGQAERLRFDLIDMANAIARTKAEIAAIRPDSEGGHIGDATLELDAIVKSTETATGDILAAAEHLQEVAWTMREAGLQTAACDIIDQRATDIYTACSFQDITGQRTRKVIQVLRYLEDRLSAMIAIWGAETQAPPPLDLRGSKDAFLNGPALPGQGLEQSDVDAIWAIQAEPPALASASPAPLPLAIERPAPPPAAAPPPAVAQPLAAVPPSVEPLIPRPERELPRPPAESAPSAAGSPFTPPVRPGPLARPPVETRPVATARPVERVVTLADIEALPFEERAALFS